MRGPQACLLLFIFTLVASEASEDSRRITKTCSVTSWEYLYSGESVTHTRVGQKVYNADHTRDVQSISFPADAGCHARVCDEDTGNQCDTSYPVSSWFCSNTGLGPHADENEIVQLVDIDECTPDHAATFPGLCPGSTSCNHPCNGANTCTSNENCVNVNDGTGYSCNCKSGYKIRGRPDCRPYCGGNPTAIPNGVWSCGAANAYARYHYYAVNLVSCSYSCNSGYTKTMTWGARCLDANSWTLPPKTRSLEYCHRRCATSSPSMTGVSWWAGCGTDHLWASQGTCRAVCSSNYRAVTTRRLQCGSSGGWTLTSSGTDDSTYTHGDLDFGTSPPPSPCRAYCPGAPPAPNAVSGWSCPVEARWAHGSAKHTCQLTCSESALEPVMPADGKGARCVGSGLWELPTSTDWGCELTPTATGIAVTPSTPTSAFVEWAFDDSTLLSHFAVRATRADGGGTPVIVTTTGKTDPRAVLTGLEPGTDYELSIYNVPTGATPGNYAENRWSTPAAAFSTACACDGGATGEADGLRLRQELAADKQQVWLSFLDGASSQCLDGTVKMRVMLLNGPDRYLGAPGCPAEAAWPLTAAGAVAERGCASRKCGANGVWQPTSHAGCSFAADPCSALRLPEVDGATTVISGPTNACALSPLIDASENFAIVVNSAGSVTVTLAGERGNNLELGASSSSAGLASWVYAWDAASGAATLWAGGASVAVSPSDFGGNITFATMHIAVSGEAEGVLERVHVHAGALNFSAIAEGLTGLAMPLSTYRARLDFERLLNDGTTMLDTSNPDARYTVTRLTGADAPVVVALDPSLADSCSRAPYEGLGSLNAPGLTCRDLLEQRPELRSGKYALRVAGVGTLWVTECDMDTAGGGWTLLESDTLAVPASIAAGEYEVMADGAIIRIEGGGRQPTDLTSNDYVVFRTHPTVGEWTTVMRLGNGLLSGGHGKCMDGSDGFFDFAYSAGGHTITSGCTSASPATRVYFRELRSLATTGPQLISPLAGESGYDFVALGSLQDRSPCAWKDASPAVMELGSSQFVDGGVVAPNTYSMGQPYAICVAPDSSGAFVAQPLCARFSFSFLTRVRVRVRTEANTGVSCARVVMRRLDTGAVLAAGWTSAGSAGGVLCDGIEAPSTASEVGDIVLTVAVPDYDRTSFNVLITVSKQSCNFTHEFEHQALGAGGGTVSNATQEAALPHLPLNPVLVQFTDISSVSVQGQVTYQDTARFTDNGLPCAVEGARVCALDASQPGRDECTHVEEGQSCWCDTTDQDGHYTLTAPSQLPVFVVVESGRFRSDRVPDASDFVGPGLQPNGPLVLNSPMFDVDYELSTRVSVTVELRGGVCSCPLPNTLLHVRNRAGSCGLPDNYKFRAFLSPDLEFGAAQCPPGHGVDECKFGPVDGAGGAPVYTLRGLPPLPGVEVRMPPDDDDISWQGQSTLLFEGLERAQPARDLSAPGSVPRVTFTYRAVPELAWAVSAVAPVPYRELNRTCLVDGSQFSDPVSVLESGQEYTGKVSVSETYFDGCQCSGDDVKGWVWLEDSVGPGTKVTCGSDDDDACHQRYTYTDTGELEYTFLVPRSDGQLNFEGVGGTVDGWLQNSGRKLSARFAAAEVQSGNQPVVEDLVFYPEGGEFESHWAFVEGLYVPPNAAQDFLPIPKEATPFTWLRKPPGDDSRTVLTVGQAQTSVLSTSRRFGNAEATSSEGFIGVSWDVQNGAEVFGFSTDWTLTNGRVVLGDRNEESEGYELTDSLSRTVQFTSEIEIATSEGDQSSGVIGADADVAVLAAYQYLFSTSNEVRLNESACVVNNMLRVIYKMQGDGNEPAFSHVSVGDLCLRDIPTACLLLSSNECRSVESLVEEFPECAMSEAVGQARADLPECVDHFATCDVGLCTVEPDHCLCRDELRDATAAAGWPGNHSEAAHECWPNMVQGLVLPDQVSPATGRLLRDPDHSRCGPADDDVDAEAERNSTSATLRRSIRLNRLLLWQNCNGKLRAELDTLVDASNAFWGDVRASLLDLGGGSLDFTTEVGTLESQLRSVRGEQGEDAPVDDRLKWGLPLTGAEMERESSEDCKSKLEAAMEADTEPSPWPCEHFGPERVEFDADADEQDIACSSAGGQYVRYRRRSPKPIMFSSLGLPTAERCYALKSPYGAVLEKLQSADPATRVSGTDMTSIITFRGVTGPLAFTRTIERTTTTSIDLDFGREYNNGGFFESEIAVLIPVVGANTDWTDTVTYGGQRSIDRESQQTTTVRIELADGDLGDRFNVQIFKDPVFGTPVYKTVGGASSCPAEPGTLYRHVARMSVVDTQSQANVPASEPTVFRLQIDNLSQVQPREAFLVRLGSLLETQKGLALRINDDSINSVGGQVLTIRPGRATFVDLTVLRSTSNAGDSGEATMDLSYVCPPSIYGIWQRTRRELACDPIPDTDDSPCTKQLSVQYLTACSQVQWAGVLGRVGQMRVNSQTVCVDDEGVVTRDCVELQLRNPDFVRPWIRQQRLQAVRVQWTRDPLDWGDNLYIGSNLRNASDSLGFASLRWELGDDYPDGTYWLRAVALCSESEGGGDFEQSVSPAAPVTVDRSGPRLFGQPTPADGVYRPGTVVSFRFTEDIDCREESGLSLELREVVTAGCADSNENDSADWSSDVVAVCSRTLEFAFDAALQYRSYMGRHFCARLRNVRDLAGNLMRAQEVRVAFLVASFALDQADAVISGLVLDGGSDVSGSRADSPEREAFVVQLVAEIATLTGVVASRLSVESVEPGAPITSTTTVDLRIARGSPQADIVAAQIMLYAQPSVVAAQSVLGTRSALQNREELSPGDYPLLSTLQQSAQTSSQIVADAEAVVVGDGGDGGSAGSSGDDDGSVGVNDAVTWGLIGGVGALVIGLQVYYYGAMRKVVASARKEKINEPVSHHPADEDAAVTAADGENVMVEMDEMETA